jgi:hypothetical protein
MVGRDISVASIREPRRDPSAARGGVAAAVDDFLFGSNPYFARIVTWKVEARRLFLNPKALRQLFVLEAKFFEGCSEEQRHAIRLRWGNEVFAEAVEGQRRSASGSAPVLHQAARRSTGLAARRAS